MLTMLPLSVGIECVLGVTAAHDAERRVFLQRDAVIAAAGVGSQPFHARHELDDLELLDLVIEPADLRLVEFEFAPRLGVCLGQRLDDLFDLAARGDALFLQLQERFLRGGAGFVRHRQRRRTCRGGPSRAV